MTQQITEYKHIREREAFNDDNNYVTVCQCQLSDVRCHDVDNVVTGQLYVVGVDDGEYCTMHITSLNISLLLTPQNGSYSSPMLEWKPTDGISNNLNKHAWMHTRTHNHFTVQMILSVTTQKSRYQKKHSPTHTHCGDPWPLICFVYLLQSMASSCSIHVPYSLFPQSLSQFSLVYLLAWHPPLHTPHISSPNHCLLFAANAHNITTCFV